MKSRFVMSSIFAGTVCATTMGLSQSAVAQPQSSVVLAVALQPETLDPYNTNNTMTQAISKTFYEGLFKFDKDLKIQPALAESYSVSDDGLVYTIKLRAGVKFHDGTEFNADAVKTNIDRVMNPDNALARFNQFNRIKSVEVVDPLTVRFVLKEPFSPFINSLAHSSAAMISPTALKKYGKKIAFHPVGTGPFKFVEWRQPDYIKGERFEDYRLKNYPKVDIITWKPVIENGTRSSMLQTGEADFAYPVPYEQINTLKADNKLVIETGSSIVTRYISFNMLQKPFNDLRVRQAINYAINRDALSKVAFNGFAFPAEGFVPQGVAYAYKMQPWPYDPAKARALLKEAGFPNGFESVLWGGYNNSTTSKALQFLQQQLAQVGIKVSVLGLETGQNTEWVQSAPDPKTAKVRMYYAGWSSSTGEADWALRPLLATEAWPPKLNNIAYYSNPKFDEYIAEALKAKTDEEKTTLYRQAQELLYVDLPWAPLVTDKLVYVHNKRLNGVYVMPDGNINFDQINVAE